MSALKLEIAARHIAQVLIEKNCAALHLADDEIKSMAQRMFFDAVGGDVDFAFSYAELMTSKHLGQTSGEFIEALLYAETENALGELIDEQMELINRQNAKDAAVDAAVDGILFQRGEAA